MNLKKSIYQWAMGGLLLTGVSLRGEPGVPERPEPPPAPELHVRDRDEDVLILKRGRAGDPRHLHVIGREAGPRLHLSEDGEAPRKRRQIEVIEREVEELPRMERRRLGPREERDIIIRRAPAGGDVMRPAPRSREEHVREAIRHLEQAGLHEPAAKLREHLHEMERRHQGEGAEHLRRQKEELEREVKRLKKELQQLKDESGRASEK